MRLLDNEPLFQADRNCEELIPVYVLDERLFHRDQWGHVRCGPIRLKFMLEGIENLKRQLQLKGSDLIFYKGKPEEIIPHLASKYKCGRVYGSKSYTTEETEIEDTIRQNIPLFLFHTITMVHPDDLPFPISGLPYIFTDFRKKTEMHLHLRTSFIPPEKINTPPLEETTIPDLEDLGLKSITEDPRSIMVFKGGETEAWNRLNDYIWEKKFLSDYKSTRNGLIGADYSSKLSPWLATGNISAKSVFHQIREYEDKVKKNRSTYWMFFELLWRDFFAFTAMKYGNRIFMKDGIRKRNKSFRSDYQEPLNQWKNGETGDSFVDANMKELLHSGYMSNRGRQNVASYLVHDLQIDWRAGASWFESQLIDYDPCSNYGNWMYLAGTGNDPRENRKFNTRFQQKKYDPEGKYISLWLNRPPQKG